MIEPNTKSWNRIRLLMPTLLASTAFGAVSCDVPDGNDVEQVSSAIHNQGSWVTPPTGTFLAPPAIARNQGGPMTAFGWGMDFNIYVTRQDSSEIWSQGWSKVPGGSFASPPAVTAIRQTSGPLTGRFAIVAQRADNQYYLTIRDQFGGNTVVDWVALPIGTFNSPPSITHIAPNSPIAPTNTLMVAGLGMDNRIWVAKNTLLPSGNFSNANWVSMGAIQNETFVSAPAIAPPCNFVYGGAGVFIAAQAADTTFRRTKWNGSSFSTWTGVPAGTFNSGPALATGCGSPAAEVAIYGLGNDNRIYYSTQLTGGPAGFTVIGTQTFQGTPSATGFVRTMGVESVMVATMNSAGSMFTSTASTH